MSEWQEALAGIARAGERLAGSPDPGGIRRRVRRRRLARVAVPAAAVAGVLTAGAILVPPMLRVPLAGSPGLLDSCGLTTQEAAAAAFDVDEVAASDVGGVQVLAGSNENVEQGVGLAVGVGVKLSGTAADAMTLQASHDERHVVAWLVTDGVVVGVLDPEFVASATAPVEPAGEVWLDGSYRLLSCDGGAAPIGSYTIVAAVAVAPTSSGAAAATAVLSDPIPVTVSEPDPLAGLGQCGSVWPADVVEATDGHALGLRIDAADAPAVSGDSVTLDVTVRNDGAQELGGWTGHPWLVLVSDGVVVASTGPVTDEGLDASLAPGESLDYRGTLILGECGTPPAPGTYEVYALMSFFFETPAGDDGPSGDRTDVRAVGGPWPLVLD